MPGFDRAQETAVAAPAGRAALDVVLSLLFVFALAKALADPFKPSYISGSKPMILRVLRAFPLGLGALIWAALTVLLMVNLLLPALGQGRMKLMPPLAGVTNPQKAKFTWNGLLHGSYQAAYAQTVGTEVPLYAAAVRLRNQVQYTLFGRRRCRA